MIPPLAIFKMDHTGDVRWLEPASNVESAKTRIGGLGRVMPGKYVLFSQKSGKRMIFLVNEEGTVQQLADPEVAES